MIVRSGRTSHIVPTTAGPSTISRQWFNSTYITTHSQTPIFCIVSRVDKRYITLQTLAVWSAIDRTLQWTRLRRESIASTSIVETCQKYGHDICRKKVNKQPRNLLNKIQNVFINGKQVKIDKITQKIPWFPRFYATKTTGKSQRYYSPHAPTVTFARWQRLPMEVSGCGQLAGGLKVGRRYKCVSK